MSKNKKNHYVDNERFLQEIVDYKKKLVIAKEQGLNKPRVSEYIGKCIYLIAENLSHKPRFMNYSFRDELVSDAIENCFLYFDNFNPDNTYNNSRTYSAVSNYYTTMYKVPAPVVENFITLGLDWMPSKNVHFMPNVWVDTYMNPAKGVVGKNKSDNDIEARMTFFYIFGRDYPNLAAKVN